MKNKYFELISVELLITEKQVQNTLGLLDEGCSIPFISRYRKEKTQGLDEVVLFNINEKYKKLQEIDKRKETILKTIDEQDKLTPELKSLIENTWDSVLLEDIYLPYKPKRKTRAVAAIEKGLEPLAKIIMKQQEPKIEERAKAFINEKVKDISDAIDGACDIIAEWVNENSQARSSLRLLFHREAILQSKVIKAKETEGEKYKDYFHYSEVLKKCPSHRFLAIQRGKQEGFLNVTASPEENLAIELLEKIFIKRDSTCRNIMQTALKDSYKRLLFPSLENEIIAYYKEKADVEAIKVFASNLQQLLMAPPLGPKRILAIDPGFKSGCKLVCLDEQGNLLHNETIFPHPPQSEKGQALKKIAQLLNMFKLDVVGIGNGTAGRETENLIKNLKFDRKIQVFIVNENGASIYSASPVAREEFPQFDVTVRGSVSIGRRLMDPLAELVKIDPQSIGVGQYQHDVDQKKLKDGLDSVVVNCVNKVGVNLNTASKYLLNYVSGLGPQLAQNIVDYRKENGKFTSRQQLKKVTRMGAKAFEQAAGFLRIPDAENPLDNSAVHPESYLLVQKMAKEINCSVSDLIGKEDLQKKIDIAKYVTDDVGLPTLNDIINELGKPGRDPRTIIKIFEFSKDIFKIDDVKPGMIVPGIITNITNFGAFVDIGVKQDGLVHISNLCDRFISDPTEVVSLNQHVMVKVLEVDAARKRIQLSMKEAGE